MNSRVVAAVERALGARQREVTDEVERILAAAVEVIEPVAPAPPRVSDIIAEAGSSNAAFYRYFPSKDDLILAVMERGVGLVTSYLQHEMAKEQTPKAQVARWIRGALAQVGDPRLTRISRAVITLFPGQAEFEVSEPMRTLLLEPVAALGGAEPERDADVVYRIVESTLRRMSPSRASLSRARWTTWCRFASRRSAP